jgi:protein-tyrosine phosphatase
MHLSAQRSRVLVLCAEEVQPRGANFPGVHVIHAGFDDDYSLSEEERTIAVRAAREVARHVRSGDKVLVTCQQGRNRSGLVAALAVHLLTGMSGKDAARFVQKRRRTIDGPALSNDYFVDLLSRLPGRRLTGPGSVR